MIDKRITLIMVISAVFFAAIGMLAGFYLGTQSQNEDLNDSLILTSESNNDIFHINENMPIAGLLINVTQVELSGASDSASRALQIHATIINTGALPVKLDNNNFAIVQYANQWYRQLRFVEPMELECSPPEEEAYRAISNDTQLDQQEPENNLIYVKCGIAYDPAIGSIYFRGDVIDKNDGVFDISNSHVFVEQIPANSDIGISIKTLGVMPGAQHVLTISKGSDRASLQLGSLDD